MNWREVISIDPRVCHGHACFVGTRVVVGVVLDDLAAGVPEAEILASYPSLDRRHIRGGAELMAAIANTSIAELRAVIEEIVDEKLGEYLGDPDQDLRIKAEVRQQLLRQLERTRQGDRGVSLSEVPG